MFDKEKLKQAMDDHGDTNKALAVFLGMTASNFSTIWNGRQPFQRKHIVWIAIRDQLSPQDVWDIFSLAFVYVSDIDVGIMLCVRMLC